MENNYLTSIKLKAVAAVMIITLLGALGSAYCEGTAALFLQQTPPQGGTISPGVGVHNFDLNTELTLTAVPKPGYQFVYWIGDVSDPSVNNTQVYLNSPKIIVAVFERVDYAFVFKPERATSSPNEELFVGSDYSNQTNSAIGGKRPNKYYEPTEEEDPLNDPLPVPEIPEPTTVLLFSAGGLFIHLKRKLKNKI